MISIEPLQKILNDMADPVSTGGAPKPPLNVGRGDDRFDSMEPRIAALEAHMEHVRQDLAKLADVPVEISTLRVRVDHLPSKGFIVTSAVSTIGAVVGLLALLQHLGLMR